MPKKKIPGADKYAFKQYIKRKYNRLDGEFGSFTRVCLRIAGFPSKRISGAELLKFLKKTKFDASQIRTFKVIWKKYIAWLKKVKERSEA